MQIALDVRPALSKPTGVGMYVAALAARLPRLAPEWSFTLFSSSFRERYAPAGLPPNASPVDCRIPVRALNYAWGRWGWPSIDTLSRRDFDLVHSPHPLRAPTRRAKSVITVHDLFFLKHPELTTAEVRRDYVELAKDNARKADLILCPSEHTRSEVETLLGVSAAKVRVTHLGVDPVYREEMSQREVDDLIEKRQLPRGGILYVGSEEKRKNLVNLVMAYMGVARKMGEAPPLVMVGPGSSFASGGSRVGPQIVSTGYLDKREIRALMAVSKCLVLVSLEEGFGLPVAEAMAARLPVVCSRGSALEEVAADTAELVDPLDVTSIAKSLLRVLTDEARRTALREAAHKRSALFDWGRFAELTLASYREVLSRT